MGKTYRRSHKIPAPHRSRTRPVRGRGRDADRYFKCWYCGFVCDVERDELGGSESGSGVAHTDALELSGESDGIPLSIALGGDIGHYHVAIELESDQDTPKTTYHNFISDISSGCPFCGSKNWRGDY